MKKSILGLGCVALAGVLAFTGCGKEPQQEVTNSAYGLVHGQGYVGMAEVTHKGNDVTKVVFDEALLPTSWAEVTGESGARKVDGTSVAITDAELVTLSVTSHGTTSNKNYAKYIKIDGVKVVHNGTEYVLAESLKKGTTAKTLFKYLSTAEGAEWYYKAMSSGKYDVCNAEYAAYDVAYTMTAEANTVHHVALTKSTRWLKQYNTYWANWSRNTDAIAAYLVEKDNLGELSLRSYSLPEDAEAWQASETDVVTGATITDFQDYVGLAQVAFKK